MSLHDDEIVSTPDLVRRLVADQFPHWAHLPVTPGPAGGTDHHLFRLGDELLVRMPKIAWAQDQATNDARWLPLLAPHLPLRLPVPEAVGEPGAGFPFRWSVTPWLDGASPAVGELGPGAARQLGEFVVALRAVSTAGGPVKDGTSRGVPLARLDDDVRAAIAASGTRIDGRAVTKAWDQALGARPASDRCWIHGDLLPGNLLADGGNMTAVIDWGGVGIGDPAADLIPAWTQFAGAERAAFRAAAADGLTDPDDAWERGRGWVLVQAVIGLPYYWDRWPEFARACQNRIATVLTD
ncbi:aminoglycoside phosphotransferase (APT) family kinase protein [Promicromonospora sp. AC04]|uniref:phosphotransferase n=1 Tax=Promicromonospora sp. AC04 TaxID=2135723 RepID=UPI000D352D09|nr:phosphotransferase [Promicromonospora sp. AC04]PUB27180.1 aminoglycoside phosphotransferase (APT) family kinase protein [Promicromonospora sp. AC04]